MKIVADAHIPQVQAAFAGLGELVLVPGRDMDCSMVRDADILLVRSVTKVNAALLNNSQVRFVASATSGIDHIDTDFLRQHDIGFVSAHGSNARSVVEYVLSALSVLSTQKEFNLSGKTAGIIGCGAVGSRLADAFTVIGMKCLLNDPPLHDASGDTRYSDLADLVRADIITLHVPYTETGPYPTRHLINAEFLRRMKADAIIINTARGGVIDETALMHTMHDHPEFLTTLDVWSGEPHINLQLLKQINIGTPHIAGYAADAKLRATAQIHAGVCDYLGVVPFWHYDGILPQQEQHEFMINSMNVDDAVTMAVLAHYDVRSDAAALRRVLEMGREQVSEYFDALRRNYPLRREFSATTLRVSSEHQAGILRQLGFTVKVDSP